jgi:hypothetical protein
MCDYSLEAYRTRPAAMGERYETRRFPSGSLGFVSPGDGTTAICMACDTRLELSRIPRFLQQTLNIEETARVTFVRLDYGPYHDGVRFADGTEMTLQMLGPGVSAVVVDSLTSTPIAPARELELLPTR